MLVHKIMILDLETQNHPYYGAVSSPKHPDNYVVAVGQAIDTPDAYGERTGEYYHSKEEAKNWLSIPEDVCMLVAHNAAFELSWMLGTARDELMRFLNRGGRVFCTQYAHYLLSNQREQYPALDEIAPLYGGTHKVDGIKILWESGVLTSEIDKTLLFDEYLLGEGGDIENTRRVFYGVAQALQDRGMWDMALLRMEGLLYIALAMDSGLHINTEVAERQRKALQEAVQGFEEGFKQNRNLPEYVEFKESSPHNMSAWLYGGPVKYRVRDTAFEQDGVTPKYTKQVCYQIAGTETYIAKEDAVSSDLELVCYKSGKNKGLPKEYSVDTDVPKTVWYTRVINLPGIVPLSVLPKDIRKSFDAEFATKWVLQDATPVYSTGTDALDVLSKRQEYSAESRRVITDLMQYAKLTKDLGTYYLTEQYNEDGTVKKQSGMLQYLNEHDVVYHSLNCTSTVTTRLSGNRPNMQNLPRGDTSDVKKVFTSRYDNPVWLQYALRSGVISQEVYNECSDKLNKGEQVGCIIEADYSALEVVVQAVMSGDAALKAMLKKGIDMHSLRLSKALGEEYTDVLRKVKDDNDPEHEKYDTLRTNIKPKTFAYQYGASAHGIAFNTGCTVQEAQAFIDIEKALFPGVESWYSDVVIPEVQNSKTLHREQDETGRWRLYGKGVFKAPDGTCFEFREYPKQVYTEGRSISTMEFKPTQIRNYPVQGTAGLFVQGATGLVARYLISKNFFDGRVQIINQVHDAVYLDCCSVVLQEVAHEVKRLMEAIPELFNPLGHNIDIPFPVEVKAGVSMFSKTHVG